MKHLVIVDDDRKLRGLLLDYLSQYAFRVTAVKDGHQLGQVLSTEEVDLFIIDLNLGHEDGLEIVQMLSDKTEAPIIIISGDRLDEADKVVGLEFGALYYVTKPFGLRELLARIKAALRIKPHSADAGSRKVYSFEGWSVHVQSKKLINEKKQEIRLTNGELNLLAAFLSAPRQVLSREQLLAATRVHEEEIFDRSVDVLVLRLRRKLESDPSRPTLIVTERSAGYIFNADVAAE